jgi:ArsR family transcriptional regulator
VRYYKIATELCWEEKYGISSRKKAEYSIEKNLEARAEFFKALGHPIRLLILNLLRMKPRHGEELATILHPNSATNSHHLGKLSKVGLLESEKDQYYQTYSLIESELIKTLADMVYLPQPIIHTEVEEDAYRKKMLNVFFKRGRLVQIPAQVKKQRIVMEKIMDEFEQNRSYPEREVDHILLDYHEDVATIRRSLISYKLMEREGGIYKRLTIEPRIEDPT